MPEHELLEQASYGARYICTCGRWWVSALIRPPRAREMLREHCVIYKALK